MTTQGERLKQIREELRLSQQEIADKLDVKYQSISKAEKNINKLSNESLAHLLIEFNVNINYVLAGIGEPFIQQEKTKEHSEDVKRRLAVIEKEIELLKKK